MYKWSVLLSFHDFCFSFSAFFKILSSLLSLNGSMFCFIIIHTYYGSAGDIDFEEKITRIFPTIEYVYIGMYIFFFFKSFIENSLYLVPSHPRTSYQFFYNLYITIVHTRFLSLDRHQFKKKR